MNTRINAILLVLLFTFTFDVQAQPATAAESAEKLRAQLLEVQQKEDALRARAQQLDEALKPENIERSLAGVGSTKPEELREARRRQLQIERDGVEAQLKLLETSRTRLESAIRDADNRAYQQSAQPTPPSNELIATTSPWSRGWLISGSAGVLAAGLVAGIFLRRRLRRK